MLFSFVGGALIIATITACHCWNSRIISSDLHVGIRYGLSFVMLPILMMAALFFIPVAMARLCTMLHPDEFFVYAPPEAVFIIVLWPFGIVLLVIYFLAVSFNI